MANGSEFDWIGGGSGETTTGLRAEAKSVASSRSIEAAEEEEEDEEDGLCPISDGLTDPLEHEDGIDKRIKAARCRE